MSYFYEIKVCKDKIMRNLKEQHSNYKIEQGKTIRCDTSRQLHITKKKKSKDQQTLKKWGDTEKPNE